HCSLKRHQAAAVRQLQAGHQRRQHDSCPGLHGLHRQGQVERLDCPQGHQQGGRPGQVHCAGRGAQEDPRL
ncbi:hypothetical protein EC988_006663, partial [Linderina pennispora]